MQFQKEPIAQPFMCDVSLSTTAEPFFLQFSSGRHLIMKIPSGSLLLCLYLLILLGFLVTHQSNFYIQYLYQSERHSWWLLAFHLSLRFCLPFWEMKCIWSLNVISLSGQWDGQANWWLMFGLWMTCPGLSGTGRLSVVPKSQISPLIRSSIWEQAIN